MDAVSQVLAGRMTAEDDAGRMFGASVIGHVLLFAAVLLVPSSWMGPQRAAPESVMVVNLGGPQGPQTGGRVAEGARPVQEVAPPTAKPEPVTPPAAAAPEMIEPVKAPPKKIPPKAPPAKVEPPREPTARTTPAKGAEIRQGQAVAETRGQGFNAGLASGAGGTGGYRVDAVNFC
jgi:outer membrane biosynthesis protein TonB